jgi:hypothetical protein
MAKKGYQFKNAAVAVETVVGQTRTGGSALLYYMNLALTAMGWTLEDTFGGVYASNTMVATGNPSNNETFTIGTKVYTIKSALTPTEGEVLRGGTAAETLDNIKLAVNRDTPGTNDGVKYKIAAANPDVECTTNTDTTQLFVARAKGLWANAYPFLESLSNVTITGGSYLGQGTAGVYDQYVYSSQGEAGDQPKGYVHIYGDSSNNFFARTYQYWDSGAHTGTRKSYITSGNYCYVSAGNCTASIECLIVGSKDTVFVHANTSSACANAYTVSFGHLPNKFITALTKLDGAHTSSVGAKALTVDSTTGFGAGSYVQILGSNGEGCDKLQITTIDSATQMTVAALPRNYADNSYLGYPACTFGIRGEYGSGDFYWHPTSHYQDAGLTVSTTNHWTFADVYTFNTIGDFTQKMILRPYAIMLNAYEHVGYSADPILIGYGGTQYDVMVVLDDFSIPPTHTATSGANTTLSDTTHSWTADALIGKYVVITGGTGNGQVRKILDNDGTSITVDTWYTNPDATSSYRIVDHVYRAMGSFIGSSIYGAIEIIDCVVPS